MGDFWLLVKIAWVIIKVRLYLVFLPLPRLIDLLTPAKTNSRKDLIPKIVIYTDKLLALDFFAFRRSCLRRSLVLYSLVKEAGVPVEINFGTATDGDKLIGHSWLTLEEKPYLEDREKETEKYKVIYRK